MWQWERFAPRTQIVPVNAADTCMYVSKINAVKFNIYWHIL